MSHGSGSRDCRKAVTRRRPRLSFLNILAKNKTKSQDAKKGPLPCHWVSTTMARRGKAKPSQGCASELLGVISISHEEKRVHLWKYACGDHNEARMEQLNFAQLG